MEIVNGESGYKHCGIGDWPCGTDHACHASYCTGPDSEGEYRCWNIPGGDEPYTEESVLTSTTTCP